MAPFLAMQDAPRLLTPAETARLLRAHPVTVRLWGNAGLITSVRTPGGHRRYVEESVRALMESRAAGGRQ